MKYLPLILRNVMRNKIRSLFTGAVDRDELVPGGHALFVAHRAGRNGRPATACHNRVAVLHEAGLAGSLPIAYVDRIRSDPRRRHRDSHVVVRRQLSRGDDAVRRSSAPTPRTIFNVYPELRFPPDQLEAWQKDKTGCVVGSLIARNKGWKIGDKIPLQGDIYPVDLELTVRGIYDGPIDDGPRMGAVPLRLHGRGAQDSELSAMRATRASSCCGPTSADKMPDVMQAIESAFASSDAPVKPMTEKAVRPVVHGDDGQRQRVHPL